MDLKKLNKEDLLAKAEELTAKNEELTASNEKLAADLAATPKGGDKELKKALDAAKEEIAALEGVVADLNERQILTDKTRGSKNPIVAIEVDGAKKILEIRHGLRKGQKVLTAADIAADLAFVEELYNKKSTAVTVVG